MPTIRPMWAYGRRGDVPECRRGVPRQQGRGWLTSEPANRLSGRERRPVTGGALYRRGDDLSSAGVGIR
ncbi:hypothetical protein [Musicola paradisiaca]|uniref:hypothetical protein n=1 Tax=Musicola paradisiaca TaxID=69223 RepID=UPI0003C7EE9F|nr:hypothetical protein [Musicola paradisiaca]